MAKLSTNWFVCNLTDKRVTYQKSYLYCSFYFDDNQISVEISSITNGLPENAARTIRDEMKEFLRNKIMEDFSLSFFEAD